MKKYRLNKDKLLRNIVVISSIMSIGMLVYKVATCGVAWISTCGYFG
jgi:hypothetical protein